MKEMERCEICEEDSPDAGTLQRLHSKSYESLINQCRQIDDSSLLEQLTTKWTSNTPIVVHSRCRSHVLLKKKEPDTAEHPPREKRQKLTESSGDIPEHLFLSR